MLDFILSLAQGVSMADLPSYTWTETKIVLVTALAKYWSSLKLKFSTKNLVLPVVARYSQDKLYGTTVLTTVTRIVTSEAAP